MVSRKITSDSKTMIIEKARKIMYEKGYDGTSMRDIARACLFNQSNIYNYFCNKEQLLYQILAEGLVSQVESVKHLENDTTISPVDQLHYIISNQVNLGLGPTGNSMLLIDAELRNLSPVSHKKIVEMRDQYEVIVRKVIRRGIDSGDFIETDEKLAVTMIFSMIIRLNVWFSPKGRLSKDEIADYIYKFAVNSLLKNRNGEGLG